MTQHNPQVPSLTLDPDLGAAQAAAPEQIVQAPAPDTAPLSDAERRAVDEFAAKIDLSNADHVLLYGAEAQKKIAEFSDSALSAVRTNDTGEVGEMLVKLVNEIKGFEDGAEKPKGLGGLFWNAKKAVSDLKTKYDKVEVNVDAIASSLEGYQVQLLKDISMFNHLYDMNTEYFRELSMYILAGEKRLEEVRSTTLAELREQAARTFPPTPRRWRRRRAFACRWRWSTFWTGWTPAPTPRRCFPPGGWGMTTSCCAARRARTPSRP